MKPIHALALASIILTTAPSPADPEVETVDDPFSSQTGSKVAQNGKPSVPRHVRVQVEFIEMPLHTMSTLLDDEEATKTDAILRQHISQLIKADKAKIVETQMTVARAGEKATSESIREFIYPTEYEPPELPTTIRIEKDTESKVTQADFATGPTPTAFETRNLGTTLEIETEISEDSRYIDLRLASDIVHHTKNIAYATWKDKRGQSDIVMPEIYTLRCNTSVTLRNGKPSLAAALSPRDAEGKVDYSRKLLVFVRANIISIK